MGAFADGGMVEYANGGMRDHRQAFTEFASGGGVDTGIYSVVSL